MYESTLVIGATGMLAEATAHLAERSDRLTFTARSSESIARMTEALRGKTAQCRGLVLDWNDETTFLSRLATHCDEFGYPSLVVAWLHKDRLGPKIASLLAAHSELTTFYQIRGSAAARPGRAPLQEAELLSANARLKYHQIILGFVLEGRGSRWHTNAEISAGVLAAIESGNSHTTIGTVDPWEMRP